MPRSTDAELVASGKVFHTADDERAAAFWELMKELVRGLGKSVRRTAAVAAMKLGAEQQAGLRDRIEAARSAGLFGMKQLRDGEKVPAVGKDKAAQYWIDAKADLADQLDERIADLVREPSGWEKYRQLARDQERRTIEDQARKLPVDRGHLRQNTQGRDNQSFVIPGIVPDGAEPLFINRLIDTVIMRGRQVAVRTTERWVTAWADDVTGYTAHNWSPGGGPTNGDLRAYLNCRDGQPVSSAPAGMTFGQRLIFPERLNVNNTLFFATSVTLALDTDDWPIIEHGVSCCGVAAGGWLLRIQFDDGDYPEAIWSFAEVPDTQRLVKPPPHTARRLEHKLTKHGYFEHRFDQELHYPLKYGIGWEWPA